MAEEYKAWLCFHFTFVLALVLYFVVKSSIDQYENLPLEIFKAISINWNHSPVVSIHESPESASDATCSPLITSKWQGTDFGCYCSDEDKLTKGACDIYSSNPSCYTVDKTFGKPFLKWKGTNLCISGSEQHYLALTRTKSECPPSHPKKCGILDLEGNSLCVTSFETCPISELKFIKSTEADKYKSYQSVAMKEDKEVLLFQNGGNGRIISEIRVSEVQPCLDPFKQNNPSQKSVNSYLLQDSNESECSQTNNQLFLDSSFIPLSSELNINKFYNENGVNNQTLPHFKKYEAIDANVKMYYKTYIGIKTSCEADFIKETLDFYQKSASGKELQKFYSELLEPKSYFFTGKTDDMYSWNLQSLIIYSLYFSISLIAKHFCWKAEYTTYLNCEDNIEYKTHWFGKILHFIDLFVLGYSVVGFYLLFDYSGFDSGTPPILILLDKCLDEITRKFTSEVIQSMVQISWKIFYAKIIFALELLCICCQYCLWNGYQGEESKAQNHTKAENNQNKSKTAKSKSQNPKRFVELSEEPGEIEISSGTGNNQPSNVLSQGSSENANTDEQIKSNFVDYNFVDNVNKMPPPVALSDYV